jgi:hypothetical protein
MVLLIERAERLKDNLPDLIVPLTRLAELVSCLVSLLPNCASHIPRANFD